MVLVSKFLLHLPLNRIRPTYTAGGLVHDFVNDQAAIARRAAFQFHGNSSAMRLAG
jgi:hypothetical protein